MLACIQSTPSTSNVTLASGILFLLAAKTAANCRPRYVRSLRIYLSAFAKGREDMPLSEFTVETIEQWFAGRKEALTSRKGNSGRLASLFAFAHRRQWIAANPMRQLEKIRIDQKPPKILSVEQAQKMMNFAMYQWPRGLAFVTLAMLAGIRPEELEKITWADVGDGIVTVDAAASKVRRRRIVHLRESACEWINFARETGAELPFRLNSRTKMLRKAAPLLGFENGWEQDILRHTAASMWLAVTDNVGLVSKELGNSPAILLTNYQELVSAESALAFWAIRP